MGDLVNDKLRAWRWARQGLDGSFAKLSPAQVLERAGWSRSVGGVGPYLTIFARAGVGRARVDADMTALRLHELPSARGCTYVVPASDFGLALRAGLGHGDAATMATARKYLGVTDREIDKLCQATADVLSKEPLDPRQLKEALGERVRNLGAEGKKRGTTTTLPLALGRLQQEGVIRRVPVNGRLDQQRYAYTVWKSPPRCTLSDQEVSVELARRFFRWAGPATVAQLAWWAGLGVKAAKAAAAALELVPVAKPSGNNDERLLLAEDKEALEAIKPAKTPQWALVGALDNISHPRRDVESLLDAADAKVRVLGDKGLQAVSTVHDLPHHAILDRGRLIGFWEFEPGEEPDNGAKDGKIVWATFAKAPSGLAAEVARVEAFVRDELGDARSFSLDSPESRGERIASLRKLAA
jgi:hypothetical protein